MPRLLNAETGEIREFRSEELGDALQQGWSGLSGERYNVLSERTDTRGRRDISPQTVPGDQLVPALQSGHIVLPTRENMRLQRRTTRANAMGDLGRETTGTSALLGVGQAASVGALAPVLEAISPGSRRVIDDVTRESPNAFMAGGLVMDTLSMLTGVGAAAGVVRAGRATAVAAEGALGASRTAGLVSRALGAGTEGAGFGALQAWIASSTHDEELTAETLLQDAGIGAALNLGLLGLGQVARGAFRGARAGGNSALRGLFQGRNPTNLISAADHAAQVAETVEMGAVSLDSIMQAVPRAERPNVVMRLYAKAAKVFAPGTARDVDTLLTREARVRAVRGYEAVREAAEVTVGATEGALGALDDTFGELQDAGRVLNLGNIRAMGAAVDADLAATVIQPEIRRGVLHAYVEDITKTTRERAFAARDSLVGLSRDQVRQVTRALESLSRPVANIQNGHDAIAAVIRLRGNVRNATLALPEMLANGETNEARTLLTAAVGEIDASLQNNDFLSRAADMIRERGNLLEEYHTRRNHMLRMFGIDDPEAGYKVLSVEGVANKLMSGNTDASRAAMAELQEFMHFAQTSSERLRALGIHQPDLPAFNRATQQVIDATETAFAHAEGANALARVMGAENQATGFGAGVTGVLGYSLFGPAGGAIAAVGGLGMNAVRRPGSFLAILGGAERAYTDLFTSRAARFSALREAVDSSAGTGRKMLGGFLQRGLGIPRRDALIFALQSRETREHTYNLMREELTQLAASPEGLTDWASNTFAPLSDVSSTMPGAMAATATRAVQYLALNLPQARSVNPITGIPLPPSDAEIDEFMERVQAIQDPYSLVDRIIYGRPSRSAVEAVSAVLPRMYTDIASNVAEIMAENPQGTSYQMRLVASSTLNMPMDVSLDPEFQLSMQNTYAHTPQQAQAVASPGHRLRESVENTSTATQRLED